MTATRERLPKRRAVELWSLRLAGHALHVGVGRYEDGRIAEVWLDVDHRVGAPFRETFKGIAMTISVALQHGVPVEAIVAQYKGLAFEPSGEVTGDQEITSATSFLDLVAQALELAARP